VGLVRVGAKFDNGKVVERPDEPAADKTRKNIAVFEELRVSGAMTGTSFAGFALPGR
jgi:hypothetical protein